MSDWIEVTTTHGDQKLLVNMAFIARIVTEDSGQCTLLQSQGGTFRVAEGLEFFKGVLEVPAATEVPPDLVIWGPGDPRPTLPIAGWNPGTGTWPEPEPLPPSIWGPNDPRPSLPIAEPPWGWGGTPPIPDIIPGWDLKYIWTAETGWITVIIPTGPHVTPSKR